MNASKMWKNDQVPGDDCTQKIPYLKCHEKFEKIYSSHNCWALLQACLLSRLSYRLFKMRLFLQLNQNKGTFALQVINLT